MYLQFHSISDEARKRHDLEEALKRSRLESDHLRQQLSEAHRVAMSQGRSKSRANFRKNYRVTILVGKNRF